MEDDFQLDGVATTEEFEEVLGGLLRTAYENGVDVTGGWDVRSDGSEAPDLDVVVTVVNHGDD